MRRFGKNKISEIRQLVIDRVDYDDWWLLLRLSAMIVYPVRDSLYPVRDSLVLGESFFVGESFRRIFVLEITRLNFIWKTPT